MINSIISFLAQSRWNIGFSQTTPTELLLTKQLGEIKWLKHHYKDRFFADPFFLNLSTEKIEIMVEEYQYIKKKGELVVLIIDRKNYSLIDRKELLEIDTHLSYPIDFTFNNKSYIYPENGASRRLSLYSMDLVIENGQSLYNVRYIRDILNEEKLSEISLNNWLADSSMLEYHGKYYIFATITASNDQLVIFQSNTPIGEFNRLRNIKMTNNVENSRPAGKFFRVGDSFYRPVQNCLGDYGRAVKVQRIDVLSDTELKETTVCELWPQSYRYNRGMHTLNFSSDNLCVIDGRGYRYWFARPLLCFLLFIVNILRKLKNF